MPVKPIPNTEVVVTVTFSARELQQLEAFASLHDLYVPEFIHRAALEAAQIGTKSKREQDADTSWLTEGFTAETPTVTDTPKAAVKGYSATSAPKPVESSNDAAPTTPAKRGVVGEQSSLAKGSGPVWDIRRALGQERLNGLGWTREHMAFVLKMSVVGVRKLEHEGKSPVKSPVARQQLLGLAKSIKAPTPAITEFIKKEEAALSKIK